MDIVQRFHEAVSHGNLLEVQHFVKGTAKYSRETAHRLVPKEKYGKVNYIFKERQILTQLTSVVGLP